MHEPNPAGGIAGREVRLRVVDGAQPAQAARAIRAHVDAGRIEAVVGWHLSSVRLAIVPIVTGRLPYVYTAPYEGGERTPGVFVVGETPGRQLLPAMRWYRREHGCGAGAWSATTTCGRARPPPPACTPGSATGR